MKRFAILLSLTLVLVLAPSVFAGMGHMGSGFAMHGPVSPLTFPVEVTAVFANAPIPFAEVKDAVGHQFNVIFGSQASPELLGSLFVGKMITVEGFAMPFGFAAQAIEIGQARFTQETPAPFPFHGFGPWTKVSTAAAQAPAVKAAPAQTTAPTTKQPAPAPKPAPKPPKKTPDERFNFQ